MIYKFTFCFLCYCSNAAWETLTADTGGKQCLVLLYCVDGIEPHKKEGNSLIPGEFCVVSLAPHERYKAKNILLYLLFSNKMPASHHAKFYHYVIENELRDLHLNGVNNHLVRVIGASLDLKGREKFMQQQTCTSYFGCNVCTGQFLRPFPG